MNAVGTNSPRNVATNRKASTPGYTFRSMKELDTLIDQSEVRVAKAEYRLRSDYNSALFFFKQTFSWKRIAQSISIFKLAKSVLSHLLKKR